MCFLFGAVECKEDRYIFLGGRVEKCLMISSLYLKLVLLDLILQNKISFCCTILRVQSPLGF